MKNQKGFTLIELVMVICVLVGGYGYVVNIIKLTKITVDIVEFGIIEILRVVGILLFPLGCILGYV